MTGKSSIADSTDVRTLLGVGAGDNPATQRPSQPAQPDVIRFDRHQATDEQRAWGNEHTAHLDLRWVQEETARRDWTDPNGTLFHDGGLLYIRPCKDGVTRFVAHMNSDSIASDFKYFERIISLARIGDMQGWVRHTFKNGDEGWRFLYALYSAKSSFLDQAPACVIGDDGWGYLCDEPLCSERVHDERGDSHTHQTLERVWKRETYYNIEICRDALDDDSDWYLNYWTGSDMCQLTPEQVGDMVNDLSWMLTDCKNLNLRRKGLL